MRVLLVIMVTVSFHAVGQIPDSIPPVNEYLLEEIATVAGEEVPEELIEAQEQWLDLNSDDILLLSDLGLLSPIQADAIRRHRLRFGDFRRIEELQVVDELSTDDIRKIKPFITVQPAMQVPKSSQSVILRWQRVLQQPAGYADGTYAGSPDKLAIRYRGNHGRFKYGLNAEKDAGETFAGPYQRYGFDFYSGFISYTPRHKIIRQVVLGDFRLAYGQGLTLSTGFGFSASDVLSFKKSGRGISPSATTDENRYLRGLAISTSLGKFTADAFVSMHKVDATLTDDEKEIKSFLTTGYHRNEKEFLRHSNVNQTLSGVALRYSSPAFSSGVVAYTMSYDLPVTKSEELYKLHQFYGKTNGAAGWFYELSFRNLLMFGEAGMSANGSVAFINGLIASLHSNLLAGFQVRSYPPDYQPPRSAASGTNTLNANERGLVAGFQWRLGRITMNVSGEMVILPYVSFSNDAPSRHYSRQVDVTYAPNRKLTVSGRFRYKSREANIHHVNEFIADAEQSSSARASVSFQVDERFEYRSRFDYAFATDSAVAPGFAIAQDVLYHPTGSTWKFGIRLAMFHCPSFDTRIYAYENDVLYSFSVPAYYGSGGRFYVNVNAKISRMITVWLRFSNSFYPAETTISSGADEINSNRKSEVKIQLRVSL